MPGQVRDVRFSEVKRTWPQVPLHKCRFIKASCRASAHSLDLRAADHGGPAEGMHVAEREHVAAVDLSVPEAVGIGEDEALVVLAGKLADERFVGLLPAARERRHAPEAAAVLFPDVEREVLLEQGRVVPGSTAFRPMPALAHKYSVSLSDPFALDVGRLVLPERKRRICN